MSGQKEAFLECDETFRDTVRFGDNSVVSVMGKINVHVNSIHTISDVFYVLTVKTNLLIYGKFQKRDMNLISKMDFVRYVILIWG